MTTPDEDDLPTVAEAVDWLAGRPATVMHRDSTAIVIMDAPLLEAFRRLLVRVVRAIMNGGGAVRGGHLTAAALMGAVEERTVSPGGTAR